MKERNDRDKRLSSENRGADLSLSYHLRAKHRRFFAVPQTIIGRLEVARVPYELLPHARTDSALEEAEALGVEASRVAKTIILETADGFVRAVLSATSRLDLRKVRDILGTKDVHLASESALVSAYPQFELGAVPPFGGPDGDLVLMDGRLCSTDHLVIEAGTHDESLRLRTKDLVALTNAMLVDLSAE
jgi:Ala-tRNA(Pro) deacylase